MVAQRQDPPPPIRDASFLWMAADAFTKMWTYATNMKESMNNWSRQLLIIWCVHFCLFFFLHSLIQIFFSRESPPALHPSISFKSTHHFKMQSSLLHIECTQFAIGSVNDTKLFCTYAWGQKMHVKILSSVTTFEIPCFFFWFFCESPNNIPEPKVIFFELTKTLTWKYPFYWQREKARRECLPSWLSPG